MSESRTTCPFCERPPGGIHERMCPRHGSPLSKRESRGTSRFYAGRWRKPAAVMGMAPRSIIRRLFGRGKV